MYEFYVLYLHVDLERQWLKCEIILLNLYRQHYWGIHPKNPNEMICLTLDANKIHFFWP